MYEKNELQGGGIWFPYQKRSIREKGETFMKKCIDAGIDLTSDNNEESLRMSRYNKQINYDLMDGKVHEEDMYKITNPFGIAGFDREIVDYPLVRPRINLLVGEESNRRFDFSCRVVNEDAVSQKEKDIKDHMISVVTELALSNSFDENDAQQKLQELEKWKYYDYQDMRERMATQILKYLWKDLHLDHIFNRGFEDALLAGEEVYCADLVSGEPILRRVNPLNLYVVRTADSPYIEDADIIVEDGYHNIGFVIDNFYEHLKPSDIDKIERGVNGPGEPGRAEVLHYTKSEPISITNAWIDPDAAIEMYKGRARTTNAYDEDGRIRVARVVWRSMRKVGELTWYDEMGRMQKRFVDEFYKPDEMLGEKVKWLWINEWWEGTRIGKDIYVKMGPRPIQFRRFTNKSASGSGYVGIVHNTNDNTAISIMDILKPYQYLYDEFMDRIKQAFAKFKGPMIELDFAKMPEDWEPEKWMYYAENMGYLIVDSFKEGRKGASTGKLAGGFNTTGKVLNPDMGNYIQQHVLMLQYIERQIGIISGIPDQRLGEIQNRETVGGVERAVMQSSHITERIFKLHDYIRSKALEVLLETAKFAWKDDDKKLQYVLDDMSAVILNFSGEMVNESEYSIFISNSNADNELRQTMKQLAQAGIQNDKINFSALMDIYTSSDIASMKNKIEMYEKEAEAKRQQEMQQQQQIQQQQIQAQMQAAQAQMQLEQAKLVQKQQEAELKAQTDIAVAQIQQGAKVQSEQVKAALDVAKLELEADKTEEELTLKEKQLEETKRSNLAKENIARSKTSSTNK